MELLSIGSGVRGLNINGLKQLDMFRPEYKFEITETEEDVSVRNFQKFSRNEISTLIDLICKRQNEMVSSEGFDYLSNEYLGLESLKVKVKGISPSN